MWNEVNVKLSEGITSDESLKAHKVISEYGGEETKEWITNLLEAEGDDKIDPDTEVKYKNKDGEEKTTTYKSVMAKRTTLHRRKPTCIT